MNTESLFREALMVCLTVGGPFLGALLIVGLIVGVLQSATQIQEPAVGAFPRLLTVVVMAAAGGPWMTERLAGFLRVVLERIAERAT